MADGVGVGVSVGTGVGVAVGSGAGVAVGSGVGVGVRVGVGVAVGFIICHPNTSPFAFTLDIATDNPIPTNKPIIKDLVILTGLV